jgi:hypothetical protein
VTSSTSPPHPAPASKRQPAARSGEAGIVWGKNIKSGVGRGSGDHRVWGKILCLPCGGGFLLSEVEVPVMVDAQATRLCIVSCGISLSGDVLTRRDESPYIETEVLSPWPRSTRTITHPGASARAILISDSEAALDDRTGFAQPSDRHHLFQLRGSPPSKTIHPGMPPSSPKTPSSWSPCSSAH